MLQNRYFLSLRGGGFAFHLITLLILLRSLFPTNRELEVLPCLTSYLDSFSYNVVAEHEAIDNEADLRFGRLHFAMILHSSPTARPARVVWITSNALLSATVISVDDGKKLGNKKTISQAGTLHKGTVFGLCPHV